MKTAFLILAHHQPDHLARLVASLQCDWARVFVHIDKKVDITAFTRRIRANCSVRFLDRQQRRKVNWGGFSTLKGVLALLDVALNDGERFDRFCFLTGSDYLIKSLSEIQTHFESAEEFMRIDRRLDAMAAVPSSQCRHVDYFHLLDLPFPGASRLSGKIRRKAYQGIPLYHGSASWSLTARCVNYAMDFIRRNPDYLRYLRYASSSDEICFQSIVKHSPFSGCISHDFETADDEQSFFALNEHGCHYIDWGAKGAPHPKVLDEGDAGQLLESRALFCRKVQEGKSDDLIRTLDNRIGAIGPTSDALESHTQAVP